MHEVRLQTRGDGTGTRVSTEVQSPAMKASPSMGTIHGSAKCGYTISEVKFL